MRAVIDTNALYVTQAGSARLTRGLLQGMRRLNPAPDFSELAWPVENFAFQQPKRALKTIYREFIWAKWIAPARLRKMKADVFHATAMLWVTPPRGMAWTGTLLDMAVVRNPGRFRPWLRRISTRQIERMKALDRVVCISQFTADEAMEVAGFKAEQLVPVLLGCDFHPSENPPEEARPPAVLPENFFLFVGSLEPGKNLALLRAMYEAAAATGVVLPDLVVVGARWTGVASEGAPPKGWHYLGHIPDAELIYLYRRAKGLLFPSKYEGFGFPVVEAMSLGCPVICARVASIPEVAGEAALYAELTVEGYLKAVRRLLAERALHEDLVAKGLAQAAKFTWEKTARETVEVLRDPGSRRLS